MFEDGAKRRVEEAASCEANCDVRSEARSEARSEEQSDAAFKLHVETNNMNESLHSLQDDESNQGGFRKNLCQRKFAVRHALRNKVCRRHK